MSNLNIIQSAPFIIVIQQGVKGDQGAPGLGLGVAKSIVNNAGNAELSGDSPSPGNNQVYGTNSSGVKVWKPDPLVSVPYIKLSDEKSGTTGGGTSVAGSQTRVLNTKNHDTHSICTLSANQFTLPAGTYRIQASAPAYNGGRHVAALYNVTDALYVVTGTSTYAPSSNDQTESWVRGQFTIAASKTFELRHFIGVASASFGLGVDNGTTTYGNQVYSVVELWKVA